MKNPLRFVLLLGAWSLAAMASAADSQPVFRWHYAGKKALLESNPESVIADVAEVKLASGVNSLVKARICEWLPGRLGWSKSDTVNPGPALRSILDPILDNESVLHVEGEDVAGANWTLAVGFPEGGTERWFGDLLKAARRFKFGEPIREEQSELSGWRFETPEGVRKFAFVASDKWVVVTDDFAVNNVATKWVRSVAANGHPTSPYDDNWLTLELSPAIFDTDLTLPVVGGVEQLKVALSWQGKYVRTVLDVQLTEGFQPKLTSWQTPKGIITDPLVSFTALRGAGDWLGSFAATANLPDDLKATQLFNWTRSDITLISEFAAPVSDARKAYGLLKKNVPDAYGKVISEYALGQWLNATNVTRSLWRGLPVFVPYFEPVTVGDSDYIKGGVFPVAEQPQLKPAPDALYEQFESRENLFYYDWEITVARVSAFEQAQRFLNLFLPLAPLKDPSYAVPLMREIVGKLENTVTEGTITGPGSVRLVRKSAIGFTGVELWLLAHWLDSENFPEFPYSAPLKRGMGSSAPAAEETLPRAKPVNR